MSKQVSAALSSANSVRRHLRRPPVSSAWSCPFQFGRPSAKEVAKQASVELHHQSEAEDLVGNENGWLQERKRACAETVQFFPSLLDSSSRASATAGGKLANVSSVEWNRATRFSLNACHIL